MCKYTVYFLGMNFVLKNIYHMFCIVTKSVASTAKLIDLIVAKFSRFAWHQAYFSDLQNIAELVYMYIYFSSNGKLNMEIIYTVFAIYF